MGSLTSAPVLRLKCYKNTASILKVPLRWSSTHLKCSEKLLAQPADHTFDYLTPTPSHLLNITLADILPKECYPSGFNTSNLALPHVPFPSKESGPSTHPQIPQGHHLVYFSPQVLGKDLLSDGTDPLQSPGPPFLRRMWAGGSLLYPTNKSQQLRSDRTRSTCRESIAKVELKGTGTDEKVFVTIDRHITKGSEDVSQDFDSKNVAMLEKRNLVFFQEITPEEASERANRPGKILTVPSKFVPDIRVPITPTKTLLARFSALSFNAHGIHLDPQYCREKEGYKNLLVHGPLSLILMLSVLRNQIGKNIVYKFDYRNLAPLYVDETMNVCVQRNQEYLDSKSPKQRKYDVWIEGSGGGFAVKGTALVGPLGESDEFVYDSIDEMSESLV